MHRPGSFLHEVTSARYPLVSKIPPRTAEGEAEHGAVMPVNAEIASCGPTQSRNPLAGCQVGLNELHFTSTLPIGHTLAHIDPPYDFFAFARHLFADCKFP